MKTDPSGCEYVTIKYNEYEKTHTGLDPKETEKTNNGSQPGDPNCPVHLMKLYVSKIHPKQTPFYPKPSSNHDGDVWYENKPLGHNTIPNMEHGKCNSGMCCMTLTTQLTKL